MLKAITLDLDNTLIDFMKMKEKSSDAAAIAMVKAGLNMPISKVKQELFDVYIKDIEGNHAFQDFLKKYKIVNNLNKDFKKFNYEKILAAAINAHMKIKFNYMKPYTGVKKTLEFIKKLNLKLAIVTDAPRLKAFVRLDAMQITDYFDVVVGKEDTNRLKPSKMPFKKALKLLNVHASETMHIGDWPEKDILGAKKLGMLTCFAKYGYNGKNNLVSSDFEINKITDLIDIIKILNNIKIKNY
jgi:HAD superfamily hydrolase (TIGR01549 family)